jgi:hypothetical protein
VKTTAGKNAGTAVCATLHLLMSAPAWHRPSHKTQPPSADRSLLKRNRQVLLANDEAPLYENSACAETFLLKSAAFDGRETLRFTYFLFAAQSSFTKRFLRAPVSNLCRNQSKAAEQQQRQHITYPLNRTGL